jgi:uncharacterized membrane protein
MTAGVGSITRLDSGVSPLVVLLGADVAQNHEIMKYGNEAITFTGSGSVTAIFSTETEQGG